MTYDQFLDKLQSRQNFSFSRWGDGEFNCMLQARPGKSNCDGNYYYPDLGKALKAIIDSAPRYYLGMQGLAKSLFPGESAKLMLNGSEWIDADILHKASQLEGLTRFWKVLSGRHVVIVGPTHLHKISGPGFMQHVYTADQNCWNDRKELLGLTMDYLEGMISAVVLISAGMAANYFVDQLYKHYRDYHTFIDAGSVFDPYCGRNSRKYHSQIIERLNA